MLSNSHRVYLSPQIFCRQPSWSCRSDDPGSPEHSPWATWMRTHLLLLFEHFLRAAERSFRWTAPVLLRRIFRATHSAWWWRLQCLLHLRGTQEGLWRLLLVWLRYGLPSLSRKKLGLDSHHTTAMYLSYTNCHDYWFIQDLQFDFHSV